MNTWQRYATKMAWSYQTCHFFVIIGLIACLNIGLQQKNPLTCWLETSFLEQITFASLLIIPFSVFTTIIHLKIKWKANGEQKLLTYLNVSPRPYIKPIFIVMTYVLIIWIIDREILWPRLITPTTQEPYPPIKLEHHLGTLIYQPHGSMIKGNILFLSKGKLGHYTANMLGSQWQVLTSQASDNYDQHDALAILNQCIPNLAQLRIFMGQEHQISIIELLSYSTERSFRIFITRIVVPFLTWVAISWLWIRALHRPNQMTRDLGMGFITILMLILISYQI